MALTNFKAYAQSTQADWDKIVPVITDYEAGLADRVLTALEKLGGQELGHPVTRLEHSLQTATRAFRDSADEDMVVCALLHDIADDLAPYNHGPAAAAILRPYVSEELAWLVEKHEIFQGYYFFHHIGRDRDEREQYRGHPAFEMTADFCAKWDQAAFDASYDSMPLAAFEPMLRRLFGRPAWGSGVSGHNA